MIKQLNPPIPMITPLGHGLAYFIWCQDRLVWYGVFQHETGENWLWLNNHIRLVPSISDEGYNTSKIALSKEMEQSLSVHRKRYKK